MQESSGSGTQFSPWLVLVLACPSHATQVTSGVSFAQISFTGSNPPEKYSHYGQISVDFNMLYGEGYINVERYENGKPAGWVVKNLPVISGSVLAGYSTTFDLGASGYQSTFSAYVDYSPTLLANDSSLKGQPAATYRLGQAEYPLIDRCTNRNTNKNGTPAAVNVWSSADSCSDGQQIELEKEYDVTPDAAGDLTFCFQNTSIVRIRSADLTWSNVDVSTKCGKLDYFGACSDLAKHVPWSAAGGIPLGASFDFCMRGLSVQNAKLVFHK